MLPLLATKMVDRRVCGYAQMLAPQASEVLHYFRLWCDIQ